MNDIDTIMHKRESGSVTTVTLLPHQRAAHIGGDLYVIRADSMNHIGRYLDNLAGEVLRAVDDVENTKGEAA